MRENIKQRKAEGDVDTILTLSGRRSKLTVESEALRRRRNELTDKLTREAKTLDPTTKKSLQDEARSVRETIAQMEAELQEVEDRLFLAAKKLPNWTHPEVHFSFVSFTCNRTNYCYSLR